MKQIRVITPIELIQLIREGWYITKVSSFFEIYKLTLKKPDAFFDMVVSMTHKEFLLVLNAGLLSIDEETYNRVKEIPIKL